MLKYLRWHNVDLHKNFCQVCMHTKSNEIRINKIFYHLILCPFYTCRIKLWRSSLCTLKHSQEKYLDSFKWSGFYVKQWNWWLKRKMDRYSSRGSQIFVGNRSWISTNNFFSKSLNCNTTTYHILKIETYLFYQYIAVHSILICTKLENSALQIFKANTTQLSWIPNFVIVNY